MGARQLHNEAAGLRAKAESKRKEAINHSQRSAGLNNNQAYDKAGLEIDQANKLSDEASDLEAQAAELEKEADDEAKEADEVERQQTELRKKYESEHRALEDKKHDLRGDTAGTIFG